MENNGEIIFYQPDSEVKLEVRIEDETVWLNRQQLSELFNRDVKTIGKHVNNALKEELAGMATVAKFATVQKEGDRTITRQVEYYNLDMVLSVGYRVKSNRGIEFRRWANRVLKEYLLKGYSVNRRLTELEHTVAEHSRKIDFFVRTSLPPVEGIFYDGQLFDAYKFATDLIRSAKVSLLLIDNYVDESVLLLFRSSLVQHVLYHFLYVQPHLNKVLVQDAFPFLPRWEGVELRLIASLPLLTLSWEVQLRQKCT